MAMALRPIDNALPTTPERPKKQAKVVSALNQKQTEILNDENKAPLLPAGEPAVDYVASDDLTAFTDPDSEIQGLIEGLDSKDWIKVCGSLNNARRFAIFHTDLLTPNLEKVVVVIVKSMKSPRSALCKTSIMASSDMFTAFGDKLLESDTSASLDQLLLQLLLKASQDKRFVCDEADKALRTMVKSMTSLPLLQKLRQYVSHGNLRVRAKAAMSISNCVSKMGLEEMKEFGLVSLVQLAADLLNDRLPEAREAARSSIFAIYNALTENDEQKQEAWQSFCQSNLQPVHAQSIAKLAPQ